MNTTNLETIANVNHKTYLFAPYENVLALQSTSDDTRLTFYNNSTTQSLTPRFVLAASNSDFRLIKDHHTVVTYNETRVDFLKDVRAQAPAYLLGNVGIGTQTLVGNHALQVVGNTYIRDSVGIGTTLPQHKLHVYGNLFADGTLMASNLVILGDYVQLDTTTSNTEQMVIHNAGTGPGLKVTQTGVQDVAAFYDDDSLAMVIADGGNVGIGITDPLGRLHVAGPFSAIMGNLGVGIATPVAGARLYVNGTTVAEGSILPGACNLYDLGSADLRWRDLYLSGQSIDIDGIRISKDYVKNTIKITNSDGKPTDTDVGTLTSSNALVIGGSLGIGTTTPVAALTVQTGDAVLLSGNLGIGTAEPQEALHVKTRALIEGHVGIGTVVSAADTLDVGGRARIQGEIRATALRLNEWADGMVIASNVIYGPESATNKWLVGSGGLAIRDAADTRPLVFVDPVQERVGFGTAAELSAKVEIFRDAASTASDNASLMLSHESADGASTMILKRRGAPGNEYGFVEYTDSNQTLAIGVSETASNVTITGRTAIESRAARHSVLGGNLGIGTQEPLTTLDVRGKSYFQDTVGIGTLGVTNATSAPLHVHGGMFLNVSDFSADSGARFYASAPKKVAMDVDFGAGPETQVLTLPHTEVDAQYAGTDVDLQLLTGRPLVPRISVLYNGNVGVGTALPAAPLDVSGNAVFRSMVSGDSAAGFSRLGVHVSASNIAAGKVLDVRGAARFIPENSNYSMNWSDDGLAVSGVVSVEGVSAFSGSTTLDGTTRTTGSMFESATEDTQLGIGNMKLFVARSNIQVGSGKRSADVALDSVDIDTHVQLRKSVFIGSATRTPTVANADFIVDHSAAFSNQVVFSSNSYYSAGSSSKVLFGTNSQPRHEIYSPSDAATELRTASLDTTGIQTWHTNGLERMRVSADGNVGIGTGAPAARLHVGGDLRADTNISSSRFSTSLGLFFENANAGMGSDGQPALRLTADSVSGGAAWGVGYLTGNQVSAGVRQVAPLQINASALVGYTAAGENWGTNNLYVGGNVGIGTTAIALSGAVFQAHGNAQFGNGLKTDGNTNDGYLGGPFFKQKSWDAVGVTHTIVYPMYCQGQNASGTLHVQAKSYLNSKLANLHISYLTTGAGAVDVFVLSHHRTPNMTTLNAYASGGDIVIETDADCAIAWTSIGAI